MSDTGGTPAAEEKKQSANTKKKRPRNYALTRGVMRYSRRRMYVRRGASLRQRFRKKDKQRKDKPKRKPDFVTKEIGGEKNGGTRQVLTRKPRRGYETQTARRKQRRLHIKTYYRDHRHRLRSSLTPGTVVILLVGPHRGKRAIFLRQMPTGLLLVTGPFLLNHCPLRRIDQRYVIATKTKIDLTGLKLPEHVKADIYFKRKEVKKPKHGEGEIFDNKKEGYKVTNQRRNDQVEVDKQVMEALKKHPETKMLKSYLSTRFMLKNGQYPHKLIF